MPCPHKPLSPVGCTECVLRERLRKANRRIRELEEFVGRLAQQGVSSLSDNYWEVTEARRLTGKKGPVSTG